MSTPYSWPASLPVFSRDPYSVSPRPGAIQVDSGIDSARALVYTEVNEVVQVEALLSGTQEIAFWNFFQNTLAMGTQSFVVPILIGGSLTNREAIFIGAPPSIVPANKYGYVRASFSLLTWPGQVDPPPPVLDYDAIVLARSPDGYWRFDEASPSTSFTDLSGNGNTITTTGGHYTYQNPTLNLDGGLSMARDNIGANGFFGFETTGILDATPDMDLTVGGWVKFANDAPTDAKTLFHLGGTDGGGQFVKLWCYRNSAGKVEYGYTHLFTGFHTKTMTAVTLPLDQAFWYETGIDFGSNRFFFRLNDNAFEYLDWGVDSPQGIDPGRGPSWFQVGRNPGNPGYVINGQFSHTELYFDRVVALGMYPDWHL